MDHRYIELATRHKTTAYTLYLVLAPYTWYSVNAQQCESAICKYDVHTVVRTAEAVRPRLRSADPALPIAVCTCQHTAVSEGSTHAGMEHVIV